MRKCIVLTFLVLVLFGICITGYSNGTNDSSTFKASVEQSADQGDATAQCNLGVMYGKGEGVQQNYTEALKWYKKAADQGDATAQYALGLMYYNGEGVQQNY
jgi:TPR repeat protein